MGNPGHANQASAAASIFLGREARHQSVDIKPSNNPGNKSNGHIGDNSVVSSSARTRHFENRDVKREKLLVTTTSANVMKLGMLLLFDEIIEHEGENERRRLSMCALCRWVSAGHFVGP